MLVLFTVAPRILSFTTGPSSVIAGDELIANCCASGNPQPIIAIDRNDVVATTFLKTNGVFEGCAKATIPTSSIAPGTDIVTTCSVALTQSLTCTTEGKDPSDRRIPAPQEAIDNCNATLKGHTTESVTNKVIGKWPNHSRTGWPIAYRQTCAIFGLKHFRGCKILQFLDFCKYNWKTVTRLTLSQPGFFGPQKPKGGGHRAPPPPPQQKPVPLLRVRSSKVFWKACPEMSLLIHFSFHGNHGQCVEVVHR